MFLEDLIARINEYEHTQQQAASACTALHNLLRAWLMEQPKPQHALAWLRTQPFRPGGLSVPLPALEALDSVLPSLHEQDLPF